MKQSNNFTEAVEILQSEHKLKLEALPALSDESPDQRKWREEKEKRATDELKIVKETAAKSEAILKTIQNRKREIQLEIGKLKYPASSSEDAALRTIGETQIQSALVLMSSNLKRDALVKAIADSIAINRIDFSSSVLDRVTATMSKNAFETDYTQTQWSRLSDSAKQKQLILDCIETYHLYSEASKIDKLQKELVELAELETRVKTIAKPDEKEKKPVKPIIPSKTEYLSQKDALQEAAQNLLDRDNAARVSGNKTLPGNQKPMEMNDFGVIGSTQGY
ncbi:MAG: hypothetical protein ABR936_05235 [Bacteroidota bacterium]|jgi:hypothetical protein